MYEYAPHLSYSLFLVCWLMRSMLFLASGRRCLVLAAAFGTSLFVCLRVCLFGCFMRLRPDCTFCSRWVSWKLKCQIWKLTGY